MKWLNLIFSALLISACQANNMNATLDINGLLDSEWILEDLTGKGVIDNSHSTIKFAKDNSLGGAGGCNRWFSSYTYNDGKLAISPIGATKKYCIGAIMKQETDYFSALSAAQKIYFDDKKRLLIDVEGQDKPLIFTRLEN